MSQKFPDSAAAVLYTYPHLSDGEGVRRIEAALSTTTVLRRVRLRQQEVNMDVGTWWHNIKEAIEDPDNKGLYELEKAELSPAWVIEQLSSGSAEGIQAVIAVAGLIDAARQIGDRIERARMHYEQWLD
jgi:hypothetical protein